MSSASAAAAAAASAAGSPALVVSAASTPSVPLSLPSDAEGGEFVSVYLRVRPLSDIEPESGWDIVQDGLRSRDGKRAFQFEPSSVFHPQTTTRQVYERVARPIVRKALEGFHGYIFAYGQTSSGKTHTMLGTDAAPGIIPLALDDVFRSDLETDHVIRMSYLEIYQEQVTDLLAPEKGPLDVFVDEKRVPMIFVGRFTGNAAGQQRVEATMEVVRSPKEVMALLQRGESSRHYGATKLNVGSSRSHTLFRLEISSRDTASQVLRVSELFLVDLAGSENIKKSGAVGVRADEAGRINQSLLALEKVVRALDEASRAGAQLGKGFLGMTATRESKLTRFLKPALGGNARTSIICTLTPASQHMYETISTLEFALRAKNIRNRPVVNEVQREGDLALMAQYKSEIQTIRSRLRDAAERERMLNEQRLAIEQENMAIRQVLLEQESEFSQELESNKVRGRELERALRAENERRSELEAKIGSLEQLLHPETERRKRAEERAQLVEMELEAQSQEVSKQQEMLHRLRMQIEEHEQESKKQKEKLRQYLQEIDAKSEQLAMRDDEIAELRFRLEELERLMDERDEKIAALRKRLEDNQNAWLAKHEETKSRLEERDATIAKLQQRVATTRDRVEQLEAEVGVLKEELHEQGGELDAARAQARTVQEALDGKMQAWARERELLIAENEHSVLELARLRDSFREVEQRVYALQEERAGLQQEMQEMEGRATASESELQSLVGKCSSLSATLAQLDTTVQQQAESLTSERRDRERVDRAFDQLTEQHTMLQRQLDSERSTSAQLRQRCDDVVAEASAEQAALTARLSELQQVAAEREDAIASLERDVAAAEARVRAAADQADALQRELQRERERAAEGERGLAAALADAAQARARVAQLEGALESERGAAREADARHDAQVERLQAAASEARSQASEQLSAAQAELASVRAALASHQQQLAAALAGRSDTDAHLRRERERVAQLESEQRAAESELRRLAEQYAQADSARRSAVMQTVELDAVVAKEKAEAASLRALLEEREQTLSSTCRELDAQRSVNGVLQKQRDAAEEANASLVRAAEATQAQVVRLEALVNERGVQVTNAQEVIAELRAALDAQSHEASDLRSRVTDGEEQRARIAARLAALAELESATVPALQQHVLRLERDLSAKAAHAEEQTAALHLLRSRLEGAESVSASRDEQLAARQAELETARAETARLRQQLASAASDAQALRERVDEALRREADARSQLEEARQRATSDGAVLRAQLDDARQQAARAEQAAQAEQRRERERGDALEARLSGAVAQVSALEQRVGDAQAALASAEARSAADRLAVSQASAHLSATEARAASAEQRAAQAEAQLSAVVEERKSARAELDSLRDKVSAMEARRRDTEQVVAQKQQQNEELRTQLHTLAADLEAKRHKLQAVLQDKLDSVTRERDEALQQLASQREQAAQQAAQLQDVRRELSESAHEMDQMMQSMESTQQRASDNEASMQSMRQRTAAFLDLFEREMDKYKKAIDRLRLENQTLSERVKYLERKLESEAQRARNAVSSLGMVHSSTEALLRAANASAGSGSAGASSGSAAAALRNGSGPVAPAAALATAAALSSPPSADLLAGRRPSSASSSSAPRGPLPATSATLDGSASSSGASAPGGSRLHRHSVNLGVGIAERVGGSGSSPASGSELGAASVHSALLPRPPLPLSSGGAAQGADGVAQRRGSSVSTGAGNGVSASAASIARAPGSYVYDEPPPAVSSTTDAAALGVMNSARRDTERLFSPSGGVAAQDASGTAMTRKQMLAEAERRRLEEVRLRARLASGSGGPVPADAPPSLPPSGPSFT